jgi:hypothetical protein
MDFKEMWREERSRLDANAPSSNVANLQRRVQLQQDALASAEDDLRAALSREGVAAPALASDPASVANFILKADRRRRGLEPLDEPSAASRAYPQVPEAAAPDPQATAAFILAADKKRRGDTA